MTYRKNKAEKNESMIRKGRLVVAKELEWREDIKKLSGGDRHCLLTVAVISHWTIQRDTVYCMKSIAQ